MEEFNRDRKVKLIALKKQYKQDSKYYFLGPIEDPERGGMLVTGLEVLPEEIVKGFDELVIEKANKHNIPIRDGQSLNLNDDFDLLTYGRCLIHSTIAGPEDTRNAQHVFYMHDEEVAAMKEAKETDAVFEALNYLKDFTILQFRDIALFLGIDTTNMKDEIIRSKVRKEATTNPMLVVKYKNLDNKENVVFCKKLIAMRIVTQRKDGYFNDGAFLASTFDGLVVTLFKAENRPILSKLSNRLEAIEKPSPDRANEFYKGVNDSKLSKELEQRETEIKIKDLQYQYLKLTGNEYEGPITVKDIESAIQIFEEENGSVDRSKYDGKSIPELKRILVLKKIDKSLFETIEDKDALIDLIVENTKSKK